MKLLAAKEKQEKKRQTVGYKSSNEKKVPVASQLTLLHLNLSSPSPAKRLQGVTAASTLPPMMLSHPYNSASQLPLPLPPQLCKQPRHLAPLGIFQLKFTVNNLTVCGNLGNIWIASLGNLAGSNSQGFSLPLPSPACRAKMPDSGTLF